MTYYHTKHEIIGLRNMLTDKEIIAAATVLCDKPKPIVIWSDFVQGDVHFSRVNTKVIVTSS